MATEKNCQELADRAAVSAEMPLANERPCRVAAERGATLAETALAEEQRCSSSMESRDAAAVKADEHAMTLALTALTELKAAPKLRYGGPPLTHFPLPLTAAEVGEIDAAILDKQCRHKTATREKALAISANNNIMHEA